MIAKTRKQLIAKTKREWRRVNSCSPGTSIASKLQPDLIAVGIPEDDYLIFVLNCQPVTRKTKTN